MIVRGKLNRFVILDTNGTDILSKTCVLMKLTKNLVTILSNLWTKYLIEIIYIQTFALNFCFEF